MNDATRKVLEQALKVREEELPSQRDWVRNRRDSAQEAHEALRDNEYRIAELKDDLREAA